MAKTPEEMTIAELQALIQKKKELRKRIPALKKEREQLRSRLEEIEEEIEMAEAGAVTGRAGDKKTTRRKKSTNGRRKKSTNGRKKKSTNGRKKRAAKRGDGAATAAPAAGTSGRKLSTRPGKRLPRGAVQDAILDALGDKTLSPAEITRHIEANAISGISPKSVSVAIDKMKKTGRLKKVGRAMYKKA